MSHELLRINSIATLDEFRYVLFDVLNPSSVIAWSNLEDACRSKSMNLAQNFEHTMRFLELLALIEKDGYRNVRANYADVDLVSDFNLSTYITTCLIEKLDSLELLKLVLVPNKVVRYDPKHDTISLNTGSIGHEFPLLKHYFTSMGMVDVDKRGKSRLLVKKMYKPFFNETIWERVRGEDTSLEIDEIPQPMSDNKANSIKGKKLFISYTHKDEEFKDDLIEHLSGLKNNGAISSWDDREIKPGEEWDEAIKKKLDEAEIVLFLVSSTFMASDYIKDVEIKRTLERYERKEVVIVPIILRSCDFSALPIAKHQALPKNAKPINTWKDRDEAFLDVVNGIKRLL